MKKVIGIILSILTITIVSCGSQKKEKNSFKVDRKKEVEKSDVDENSIALSSNDMMQFDKAELKVKGGKKVTLTLRHTGKLDKNTMGHNFVLLAQDTDIADFASKAAAARETGYIPDSDAIIASTKLIGGGETTTIIFDAPPAGVYDYICSFPGHYGVMQGKFIVE